MKFELCTDSVAGAIAAEKFGFNSIELCAALSVGGLTPNFGLIKHCVERSNVEIHTMIRHREGGFQISAEDLKTMKMDILAVKDAGASGVVFGILDANNELAMENKELALMAQSLNLKTTFHRAFDFVPDFRIAAKQIVELGFDRLLTSGLQDKAENGISIISEIQQTYGDQIQVIAGSGVGEKNALKFFRAGIGYLHFTARKPVNQEFGLGMGQEMTTDFDKIKSIVKLPFTPFN